MELHGQFAVLGRNIPSCSAAPAVTQERKINPSFQIKFISVESQSAEFDEVVSGTAGSQLMGCSIFVLSEDTAERPVLFHYGMLFSLPESSADAEGCCLLNHIPEPSLLATDSGNRKIQNRQLHTTGNVHSYGVGDDGIASCKDSPNGQSIPYVRIRH